MLHSINNKICTDYRINLMEIDSKLLLHYFISDVEYGGIDKSSIKEYYYETRINENNEIIKETSYIYIEETKDDTIYNEKVLFRNIL
ncbi:hypothetical protein [Crassaminicella profunda]|uniref:hypothetical protein n=1 Tax=Crassaminicella profunda TaxID=1286698 RepID=UPI001CA67193|nr:hypothetical protein [Crassaminicella profunda]QZY56634.1 hypothetical protein K7H06_06865 [Crassaminicella profunda]